MNRPAIVHFVDDLVTGSPTSCLSWCRGRARVPLPGLGERYRALRFAEMYGRSTDRGLLHL